MRAISFSVGVRQDMKHCLEKYVQGKISHFVRDDSRCHSEQREEFFSRQFSSPGGVRELMNHFVVKIRVVLKR